MPFRRAEKLCFSVSLYKDFAAMPPCGGVALRMVGKRAGKAEHFRTVAGLPRHWQVFFARIERQSGRKLVTPHIGPFKESRIEILLFVVAHAERESRGLTPIGFR